MSINITNIDHIAIIVSDYERSKQFYLEILGGRIIAETYREERQSYKLDLVIGEHHRIELFTFPGSPPRASSPEACGLRHLAFAASNLQQAIFHLHDHGVDVEPVRVDRLTGKRLTFFHDPDHLPIELYER